MSYREPGVYLEVRNNPRGALAPATLMIPLIIGSGAKRLKKTVAITRATAGQVDVLPFTSVSSINHISSSKIGASEWEATTDVLVPKDYTFVEDTNEIVWESGKGPATGSVYYVTVVHHVEASQYELRLCNLEELLNFYGPDIQENEANSPVNPISLGGQIVLSQGSPLVYMLQVDNASAEPTAAEYQLALDTHAKFAPGVWRIVPMDQSLAIQTVVTAHLNLMSTVEERMERSAFYGKAYDEVVDPAPSDFSGVLTSIGNLAQGTINKRISVIYPDVASRTLSDGVTRDLSAPYILAAIAGAENATPVQRSLTRMPITGFNELKGVKMTRTQKNTLAAKGVMILEQASIGSPIIIRHQLTTDMISTQSRENSILGIQDYCAKYLRNICEPYIGRFNINPELTTMITGTLEAAMNTLKGLSIINDGRIDLIEQDEENPDTVIISLSVLPPYPCNYINITLVLE